MERPSHILTIGNESSWITSLLRSRGHHVTHAESVAAALHAIEGEDPDLVVVDAALPGGGALTLCRALRIKSDEDRPVVVASRSDFMAAHRSELLLAGAWECVTRPTGGRETELMIRLETFMRAHRVTSRDRHDSLTDPSTGLYNTAGLSRRARELGAHLFRNHGPLACVVLGLRVDPDTESAVAYCGRVLQDEGRTSDVIARLGSREIAILAPRTDALGAVRLAERIGSALRSRTHGHDQEVPRVDLRGAYEAVPDLGYAPLQPIDLVVRTAATMRATPPSPGAHWLEPSGGAGNGNR